MTAAPLADLLAFLDGSPSPYHAAASSAARLQAAGFTELALDAAWDPVPAQGYVMRGGAIVAWHLPASATAATPFRLAGAHTDSPNLRIKPRPDAERCGWHQLNVEVYGGILNNSWLDRDLGIAGRLTAADGTHTLVHVGRPLARVPQLAIHLDRGVNDGLTLNPQDHLRPVWGTVASGGAGAPFGEWIAAEAGAPAAPVFWELGLYDVQPAAVLGADASLIASGRLDNQLSCWAATTALAGAAPGSATAMIVLNDHEEVGSASTTGASGPLLEQVLERLVLAHGGGRQELLQALAGSTCVSADNAHAVHPNYPERHDPDHGPIVNRGPAIKLNSNQRYATSDATAAVFARACADAGVPHQVFVSRNNMPCGSTIGPLTATRLGIATVDVGVPQLSMHSARELAGAADPQYLAAALTAYFAA